MLIRLAAFIAGCLCAALGSAQTFPPPIVFTRTGPTFTSGVDTLTLEFADIVTVDDFGNAFMRGGVRRNGSTSYVNAVLQSDGTTVQLVGDTATFGGAMVPPTTQPASFDYRGASASGACFTNVTANSENAIVMKRFNQPRRAITDVNNPAPGVLGVYPSYFGFAPNNFVILEDSANSDLWVGNILSDPAPFSRVFQLNSPAPGMAAGVTVSAGPRMLAVNSSATYAFVAGLAGPGITFNTNERVIIVGQGAASSIVARAGTPAPGISDGTISTLPDSNQYDYLFLSDTGEVAFNASVSSPTRGGRAIFAGPPGSVTAVGNCGSSVIPGLPGRVNDLRLDVSPNGHRVLWVGVNPSGAATGFPTSGLITGTTSVPTVIVRSGQTAPGLPAGTTIGQIKEFVVNDMGWIAFRADFSASASYPTGGTALFGWSGGPGIALIFAPGQVLDLGGGVFKTLVNASGTVWLDMNSAGLAALPVGFSDGSGGVIGRNIYQLPPPLGVTLTAPVANAQSISTEPILSWTASSNADFYSVSITPEGGSTSTYSTTATSFTVPSGILQGCSNITWGVTAINPSGSTSSTPPTQTFTTFSLSCVTPPVYSIQNIGLSAPVYQSIVVTQVTPSGLVGGYNQRYGSGTNIGQDSWIWNGQMSQPLALTTVGNEGSSLGGYARRSSSITSINPQGKAVGTALRYSAGNVVAGTDAWYYDGANPAARIGLIGPGYDMNPNAAVPQRSVSPAAINASGLVIGGSARWSATGSAAFLGSEAWLFDGTSTSVIGLLGAGYQYTTGGETYYDSSVSAINVSGQVLGTVRRYTPSGGVLGNETWIKSGSAYTTVLVTGAPYEFTNATGLLRNVNGRFLNDAGQVSGLVSRRNSAGQVIASDAFFWSAGAFQIIDPADAVHAVSSTTARFPDIKGMTPSGFVVGETNRFDAAGGDLGTDVWFFDGTQTRLLGLTGPQFQTPAAAADSSATKRHHFVAMNAAGQVLGRTEYLPYTATIRPVAGWLFDPATGQTTMLTVPSGGIGVAVEMSLNEQGGVIGRFESALPNNSGTTTTSFIWSPQTGMRTLASRVLGGLLPQGWNGINAPFGGAGNATHNWSSMIAGTGDYPTSINRRGFILTYVPAPGGFPLLAPPNGASVGSAQTTHTWAASPGASSYTIAFTPEGGPTTLVETTSTSVPLPSSLSGACEHITWTVIANAPTGSTISTPPTSSFMFLAADFNQSGAITVQDIFDFLSGWFTGDPRADFDMNGMVQVQDIFGFLAAWFVGCP